MNESLQNALAEIITSALQNAGAAKDFILAEMPDVVQQLLMWKLTESLLYFVLGVLILSVPFICGARVLSMKGKAFTDDSADLSARGAWAVAGGISAIFGFLIGSEVASLAWLQILIAPKVYLIEYASELVK